MQSIIFALFFVVAITAQPLPEDEPRKEINILFQKYEKDPAGNYEFSFETENGIQRIEQGEIKEVLDEENVPHLVVVVRGTYSYPKEDGSPETITYWADESGYHAEGSSIPKSVQDIIKQ